MLWQVVRHVPDSWLTRYDNEQKKRLGRQVGRPECSRCGGRRAGHDTLTPCVTWLNRTLTAHTASIRVCPGEIESHLQSTPGVAAVGFVQTVPTMPTGIEIEYTRFPNEVAETAPTMAMEYQVTPGYFRAMGIGLLAGRTLSETDRPTTPRVLVVNETLARGLFSGRSALGERLTVVGSESDRDWQSVGVVSDVRTGDLTESGRPQLYTPYAQLENPYGDPIAVVRVSDEAGNGEELIRQALASVRPDLSISDVRPLEADLSDAVARQRLITWLVSGFAGIAVGLAALGLYGIALAAVQQRMHELSVRMMLGANATEAFGIVLRYAAGFTGLGLVIGACTTVPVGLTLGSLLYDVEPTDLTSIMGAVFVLAVTAGVAALVPALRAARIDLPSSLLSR